ncbi:MAG TPA: IS110 family transposase [Acidimicrobiaceae bacterium]|nr:IS110 family transposase [Acidimicrobiaceae bacterium]
MTADIIDPIGEVIVGVDTHADQHTAVAINGIGQIQETLEVPTTTIGFRQLVGWARELGRFERAGVEGCGSYGAGLARHLTEAGVTVIEVDRPNRRRRRRRGKSDPTDAESAARAVLAGEAATVPKLSTGTVEGVRILHLTRRSAVKARVQAGNQIKDLVLTAPEPIRAQLRDCNTKQRVKICAAWRPGPVTDPTSATRRALRHLARRWLDLAAEIKELETELLRLLRELVPSVLAERGVGIDVAAKLVIAAGENPERLRNEASFAALCGSSPVDASSGKHAAHRLNRGGNRQANNALYTVALHRTRTCDETKAYIERRRSEGKTDRAIRRCLKRALARRFHRLLVHDLTSA